jgi:PBP1b-binding outer membrane lipoprotein LpoB
MMYNLSNGNMLHVSQGQVQPTRRLRFGKVTALAAVLLVIAGCSHEPAIGKENFKVIGELKTAIAAKRTDWLEAAAKHVDEHHQQGKLSDEENAVLQSMIAAARQKNWDDASAQLLRLINAQHGP